jgi:tetratricopeptide (TPR) repeat protein
MLLLFVAAALAGQQSKAPGTFDDPKTTFRSAGVRGTIDTSGYAASAAVKTQTEFFRELADLQTVALRPAWAPCSGSEPRRQATQLLARGDFAGAAAVLEASVHSNDDAPGHQLLGVAYEGTGQLEAAAEQFRAGAALRPDDAAFFAQGVALLFAGEVTRAESVFRGRQTTSPSALTRLGLAAALFQRGEVAEALGIFLDVAVAKPDESAPFSFVAIAIRSADSAELTRCIEILTSLTRKAPKNGYAHYALACALASHNAAADEIMTELQEALALAPGIAGAHFLLAEMYADKELLVRAISEYRAALECDPRGAEPHYRLAQLYARSGEEPLAKEQFELHKQMRAQQRNEIESGRVPIRLPDPPCR